MPEKKTQNYSETDTSFFHEPTSAQRSGTRKIVDPSDLPQDDIYMDEVESKSFIREWIRAKVGKIVSRD